MLKLIKKPKFDFFFVFSFGVKMMMQFFKHKILW